MNKKLLRRIIKDAMDNANARRLKYTGKAQEDAREEYEECKNLLQEVDDFSNNPVEEEVMAHFELPVSELTILNRLIDNAITQCANTIEGKRQMKRLIDIQIILMGGK